MKIHTFQQLKAEFTQIKKFGFGKLSEYFEIIFHDPDLVKNKDHEMVIYLGLRIKYLESRIENLEGRFRGGS